MNVVTEHREVEFKFRVPEGIDLDLNTILTQTEAQFERDSVRAMTATYYDTTDLNLLRWGITLRHRVGGGDDGWHMKVPADPSGDSRARDEIRIEMPPGIVPAELASIAAPLIRRQEIIAMAQVDTERTPFIIKDPSGNPLLEVVDDQVHVSAPGKPATAFHEVEVELLVESAGATQLARALGEALVSAGAQPSSLSKAAQALGRRAADPPDVPVIDYPGLDGSAVDALQAIFSRYVRDLLIADVGVRRELPDSVHQMRVSCRRLRGALTTFRPILDPEVTSFLREELAWLATELGHVRDTEVQLATLGTQIPDDESRDFVREYLQGQLRAARSSSLAALRSDRHDHLIEDLIHLVAEPPVAARAFDSVRSVLPECLNKPWRKLKKSVDEADIDTSADQWHRIRIDAKKARYAIEAVAPIFGVGYRSFGKSLSWMTDTLGSRQDAQVSKRTLEQIATVAPARVAFHLGVQAAHCDMSGNDDVREFLHRWPSIERQARKLGFE